MSLKMHILVFLSDLKSVTKGKNSCWKQCFMAISLLNVKTYRKNCYKFFCFVFLLPPDL